MEGINKERAWETLDSEYLIRRPWLTARRDHVRLPNGVEHEEYYVLEYPDWVNIIAITREGDFLMERQYRHALGLTCFELCAGVCEAGETPIEAARRELMEETGFGGGEWRPYCTLSANPSTMNNLCHTFVATHVERLSAPHREATEDISLHFLPPRDVKHLLEDDQIKQALMAAPLWRYFAEHRLI